VPAVPPDLISLWKLSPRGSAVLTASPRAENPYRGAVRRHENNSTPWPSPHHPTLFRLSWLRTRKPEIGKGQACSQLTSTCSLGNMDRSRAQITGPDRFDGSRDRHGDHCRFSALRPPFSSSERPPGIQAPDSRVRIGVDAAGWSGMSCRDGRKGTALRRIGILCASGLAIPPPFFRTKNA